MSQQCTTATTKANRMLGCIHRGIISRDKRRDHPTLLSACQAVPGILCPVLILTIQERRRETGKGPKEGHEDDQRAGEAAL